MSYLQILHAKHLKVVPHFRTNYSLKAVPLSKRVGQKSKGTKVTEFSTKYTEITKPSTHFNCWILLIISAVSEDSTKCKGSLRRLSITTWLSRIQNLGEILLKSCGNSL